MTDATRRLALALIACVPLLASPASAETGAEIDAKVDAALERLYAAEPMAKELAAKAIGILVFPEIVKGGVIVGGQYGEGALRVGGETRGYFSIAGASFGLQFGGQTFGYALFVMTEAGAQYLRDVQGFELGVGPTLVGGDQGWTRSMGTNDIQGDIAPVVFGQSGFMAGGGIQGSKITRIDR